MKKIINCLFIAILALSASMTLPMYSMWNRVAAVGRICATTWKNRLPMRGMHKIVSLQKNGNSVNSSYVTDLSYSSWVRYVLSFFRFNVRTEVVTEEPFIRNFQERHDKEQVLALIERSYYWLTGLYGNAGDAYNLLTRLEDKQKLTYQLKVLCEDNNVIGFIVYDADIQSQGLGMIRQLVIKKEAQGKGYGRLLVQYAIDQLVVIGAKKIQIITYVSNIPAQKVFQGMGFEPVARIRPANRTEDVIYLEKRFF